MYHARTTLVLTGEGGAPVRLTPGQPIPQDLWAAAADYRASGRVVWREPEPSAQAPVADEGEDDGD
ncbi:MAG: hypothetical protein HRU13_02220 [Phycisphaerales bacterium]|nr:hypothetical protein [Phycisphaerales bacterium]